MKLRLMFALLLSLGSLAAAADSVEDLFVELPDHEVMAIRTLANLSVDSTLRRHSARVRNCAEDISHIMLRVENAPLHVRGAGVLYTDGTNKSYNFSYTFPAGYDSPWMDLDRLRTPGKCVKSVFVNAKSNDANERSLVKVLGNTN